MDICIPAPAIDGQYVITKGDNKKWYITRYADCYRNGGQNANEYEHETGYGRSSSAKRWVANDLKRIMENQQ
jgi:hypothetical protein